MRADPEQVGVPHARASSLRRAGISGAIRRVREMNEGLGRSQNRKLSPTPALRSIAIQETAPNSGFASEPPSRLLPTGNSASTTTNTSSSDTVTG